MKLDPVEMGKRRMAQIVYVNRYCPAGNPRQWDDVPLSEFLAYHDAVGDMIKRENEANAT